MLFTVGTCFSTAGGRRLTSHGDRVGVLFWSGGSRPTSEGDVIRKSFFSNVMRVSVFAEARIVGGRGGAKLVAYFPRFG